MRLGFFICKNKTKALFLNTETKYLLKYVVGPGMVGHAFNPREFQDSQNYIVRLNVVTCPSPGQEKKSTVEIC